MGETTTSVPRELELLHRLRIGGVRSALPPETDELVRRGWLVVDRAGCLLTDAGCAHHEELLAAERRGLDLDALADDLDAFEVVARDVWARCTAVRVLRPEDAEARAAQRRLLQDSVRTALRAVHRSMQAVPRFRTHAEDLQTALGTGDEHAPLSDHDVTRLERALTECHDDYLLTLGASRGEDLL